MENPENAQKCPEGNTKTSGQSKERQRGWAITIFPKDDDKPKFCDKLMKWLIFSLEKCPKTEKDHYQTFVYFYDKKSFKSVSKYFGNAHVEPKHEMATFEDNRLYIKGPYLKDGKRKPENPTFEEFGFMPEQGARTDLYKLRDEVLNGKSVDDICIDNPIMFHQYGRTLERIEAIRLRKQYRTEMTKGIWYWGKAHSGKSHKLHEDYNPDTCYVKNLNEEWWDGYKGQPIVIFNEFRGSQIRFSELLDLVDKYPKTVKWRGREPVPFLAKEIRISCIMRPEETYRGLTGNEPWDQFYRRFEIIECRREDWDPNFS